MDNYNPPENTFQGYTVQFQNTKQDFQVFLGDRPSKQTLKIIAIAKKALNQAFFNLREVLYSKGGTHQHKKNCSFTFKLCFTFYRNKVKHFDFGMCHYLSEFIRIMLLCLDHLQEIFEPIHEILMQEEFHHSDHSVLLRPYKHNFILHYENHFLRLDLGEELARFTKIVNTYFQYLFPRECIPQKNGEKNESAEPQTN